MRRPGHLVVLVALLVFLIPIIGLTARANQGTIGPAAEGQEWFQGPTNKRSNFAGLDGPLSSFVRTSAKNGAILNRLSKTLGLLLEGDRLRVSLVTSNKNEAYKALHQLGGEVEFSYRRSIQALVPINSLRKLAQSESILRISTPRHSIGFATAGEGVGAINASTWHQNGVRGTGVKIGILDSGFANYQDRQTAGDLPQTLTTANFCADGFTGGDHGTAVAEIVHEVAPESALYLMCASTPEEWGSALSYAKNQGIKIITSSTGSVGFDRGDGQGGAGTLDAVVRDAANSGILWINAVGNYGESHWSGTFSDPDGDQTHNFGGSDDLNDFFIPTNYKGCIILKWDRWPTTNQDFDLYLVRLSDFQIVAASEFSQTGSEPPVELICFEGISGSYGISIVRYSASSTPRFDLYEGNLPFEYKTPSGSVGEPASSPHVLGVGAVCWQQDVLETYSSQGPTIDGRIKPDITAPDSVSSGTYGSFSQCGASGFPGTSASAPHVAGAAALIAQQNPTWTAIQLRSYLEASALDRGTAGRDNLYGSGELYLPITSSTPTPTPTPTQGSTPTPAPTTTPTPTPSPTPLDTTAPFITRVSDRPDPFTPNGDGIRDRVRIRWSLNETAWVAVRIRKRNGGLVKVLAADWDEPGDWFVPWTGRNRGGKIVPAGRYRYEIVAIDVAGNRREAGGSITVRR